MEIFIVHGYPNKFVKSVIKSTMNNRQREQSNIDSERPVYVKLPHMKIIKDGQHLSYDVRGLIT